MKQIFQRFVNFWNKHTILVIFFIVLPVLILFCSYGFEEISIKLAKSSSYFQTIFIGLITFSIPFLWNAYQQILEKKKHITGEKIENILTKEFYQKSVKYFEIWLQYPAGIAIFLGLFIIPFLPLGLGVLFAMSFFLYFLLFPQIFQKIEERSSVSLKDFLIHKEAESPDVRKAFLELWQRSDQDIEKEFSIKSLYVFQYFTQKIDYLLGKEEETLSKEERILSILKGYLNDFLTFINNRSIISLVILEELFPKILEWHFKIWEKEYRLLKEDKLDEWRDYNEISRILDIILGRIEERSLKERESFSFFVNFRKHAENYKKESIDVESEKHYYRESLLDIFYRVFFENIGNSEEKYDIWEHCFPEKWKVTKSNLEDKENIISWVSLNKFLRWAWGRICQAKEDFDQDLEEVSKNLFPDVEPDFWARILLFVLAPYGECRVKSVIERPWNFGIVGRMVSYSSSAEENEEELFRKMEEKRKVQKETEIKNTFELVYYLAKIYPEFNQFSKENLKEHIKDLEKLMSQYENESKEENKRLRLLNIFTGMLRFLSQ